MKIASVRSTTSLLAAAACLLVLVPAYAQTPEDEVRQVIEELDRALESNDHDAIRRVVAPKFVSLPGSSCGPDADDERGDRAELMELTSILADNGVAYDRERRSFDAEMLGGGPIAVVRTRVWENLVWATGSMAAESDETYFLNRIGGRYQIIILEGHQICDTVVRTGDAPE